MPKIFDNIENHLIDGLKYTLDVSHKADFCVGYFNLRGWKEVCSYIDKFQGGEGQCYRLLIGMQKPPSIEDAYKFAMLTLRRKRYCQKIDERI